MLGPVEIESAIVIFNSIEVGKESLAVCLTPKEELLAPSGGMSVGLGCPSRRRQGHGEVAPCVDTASCLCPGLVPRRAQGTSVARISPLSQPVVKRHHERDIGPYEFDTPPLRRLQPKQSTKILKSQWLVPSPLSLSPTSTPKFSCVFASKVFQGALSTSQTDFLTLQYF